MSIEPKGELTKIGVVVTRFEIDRERQLAKLNGFKFKSGVRHVRIDGAKVELFAFTCRKRLPQ